TLQLRATMSAIRHPCLIVGRCPSNFEGRNNTTIRPLLVFCVRFSCSHFHKVLVRYRSCPAFPIASSDIDSDPERTTTPVVARLRYVFRGHYFFHEKQEADG
ncbi:MAG: hypothetical protein BECKG1743E_GA0114224_112941, partial [Candidatus Kentron sp. G]